MRDAEITGPLPAAALLAELSRSLNLMTSKEWLRAMPSLSQCQFIDGSPQHRPVPRFCRRQVARPGCSWCGEHVGRVFASDAAREAADRRMGLSWS